VRISNDEYATNRTVTVFPFERKMPNAKKINGKAEKIKNKIHTTIIKICLWKLKNIITLIQYKQIKKE
jgi:hypothetical protein